MWLPERSVRMKRFIFGFQRRVWCPKWTPLSSSWRMVTTAMAVLLVVEVVLPIGRPAILVPGAHSALFRRTCGVFATVNAVGTRSHPVIRDALQAYQAGVPDPPSFRTVRRAADPARIVSRPRTERTRRRLGT